MNRIILIGNGFDLAHGLKTSYADFIDWYWREWGKKLLSGKGRFLSDILCSFKLQNNIQSADWFYVWSYDYPIRHLIKPGNEQEILKIAQQNRDLCEYTIYSPLFEKICEEIDKPWCSIEDIYYALLKLSDNPKQINDELEFIKDKLIEYLISLGKPSLNPIIQKQILEPIFKEDISIGSKEKWSKMLKERLNYSNGEWQKLIEGYTINKEIGPYSTHSVERFKNLYKIPIQLNNIDGIDTGSYPTYTLPDNIMLLNFNYTDTADMYLPKSDRFSVNHIHGSLSKPESVIFGYGDERDDEYEKLMKKNDNEYLRHIKSFRYLDASNYRRMLAFIESDSYQICIMGHSCGVTDRTLLSTLFEHPNCVSIKPYYYQKEDGTDNYRELVQNIARNFSGPRLMRDRVVGKERCEALGKVREG